MQGFIACLMSAFLIAGCNLSPPGDEALGASIEEKYGYTVNIVARGPIAASISIYDTDAFRLRDDLRRELADSAAQDLANAYRDGIEIISVLIGEDSRSRGRVYHYIYEPSAGELRFVELAVPTRDP
ncbi:MAG: hypothetical protein WD081_07940 [Gammaproteobacteria bacterium]